MLITHGAEVSYKAASLLCACILYIRWSHYRQEAADGRTHIMAAETFPVLPAFPCTQLSMPGPVPPDLYPLCAGELTFREVLYAFEGDFKLERVEEGRRVVQHHYIVHLNLCHILGTHRQWGWCLEQTDHSPCQESWGDTRLFIPWPQLVLR